MKKQVAVLRKRTEKLFKTSDHLHEQYNKLTNGRKKLQMSHCFTKILTKNTSMNSKSPFGKTLQSNVQITVWHK